MINPFTCILHQSATPILYPHSLCLFRLKDPAFLCPHVASSPSLPSSRRLLVLIYVHGLTFAEEICSGHLRIWHTTFYVRAECGFSVLVLSPLGDIPLQILSNDPQCVDCPDVTDWVAALVGWPKDGIWRAGAPHVVGKGGVGLQSMANKKYLKCTDWKHVFSFPLFRLQTLFTADMVCSTDTHNIFH